MAVLEMHSFQRRGTDVASDGGRDGGRRCSDRPSGDKLQFEAWSPHGTNRVHVARRCFHSRWLLLVWKISLSRLYDGPVNGRVGNRPCVVLPTLGQSNKFGPSTPRNPKSIDRKM